VPVPQSVRAFFAAPNMLPPAGVYGSEDLEGRPGALCSSVQVETMRTVYDVSCPGCGRAFALDPDTQPISGDPGEGYATELSCAVEIRFRACCGWHGRLERGVWVPFGRQGQETPAG